MLMQHHHHNNAQQPLAKAQGASVVQSWNTSLSATFARQIHHLVSYMCNMHALICVVGVCSTVCRAQLPDG